MSADRHARQIGGYCMLRDRRAVTVCNGMPAPGKASPVSGGPIAAGRSRRGDHHRDIVNIAWDYGRAHPIAPRPIWSDVRS